MPGRLRSSYRSGNLAEHLGLLLLKGVAAVAEVQRPEDVGLDAIATLLRRDDDGNCYAEESFLVQLKSESESSIQYDGHELEWLLNQTQPMFIGRVSLARSEISLHPTIFANHAVLATEAKRVTLHFGPSKQPPFFRGQTWGPWKGEANEGATVWLGEPLLQWTLADISNQSWAKEAYASLKRFILYGRRELELLSFGQNSVLNWTTNDAASIKAQVGLMKGGPDELASVVERCAPALRSLMLHAFAMRNDDGNKLMLSLLMLADALRNTGMEIDPEKLFGKFFVALNKPRN